MVGICSFISGISNGARKDKDYLVGGLIERSSGERLMLAKCSYAGGILEVYHGFDAPNSLKSSLAELLFGISNVGGKTKVRNDNSGVVERVHSISSVTKERRL